MRDSKERQYSAEWLQTSRPQPMYDSSINEFYDNFYVSNPVHNSNLDSDFKESMLWWLKNHKLNTFEGLNSFTRIDVINGCTQYIDDLYQRCGSLHIFENDYKYHWRLNPSITYVNFDTLTHGKELLISMPFPFNGDVHPQMDKILDKCHRDDIPVHIDGAWISCIRDIKFDFSHPAIKTFGVSLSKGGLGGNRIGIRLSKEIPQGAITIMNDFNMNNQALVSMGIKFVEKFGVEYFWRKYENEYFQVCKDFGLTPTKAIHLAIKDNAPVGIRPLLRYLKSVC